MKGVVENLVSFHNYWNTNENNLKRKEALLNGSFYSSIIVGGVTGTLSAFSLVSLPVAVVATAIATLVVTLFSKISTDYRIQKTALRSAKNTLRSMGSWTMTITVIGGVGILAVKFFPQIKQTIKYLNSLFPSHCQ